METTENEDPLAPARGCLIGIALSVVLIAVVAVGAVAGVELWRAWRG